MWWTVHCCLQCAQFIAFSSVQQHVTVLKRVTAECRVRGSQSINSAASLFLFHCRLESR
jgi:hypothetical protein